MLLTALIYKLLRVGLQWTSPELLRKFHPDLKHNITGNFEGTQAGDVYSAGVVMKEVFSRSDPYTEFENLDLEGNVKYCHSFCGTCLVHVHLRHILVCTVR